MDPHTIASDGPLSDGEPALPQISSLRTMAPLRLAKTHILEEYVDRARYEIATVLQYWGYRPELWTIVGFTTAATDRLAAASPVAHPIVEVLQSPVVVRCQPLSLSERDIVARHAFIRHLATRGLPIPAPLNRPDGTSYAVVPVVPLTDPQQSSGFSYVLENAIYEVQEYMPGRRFVTDGPSEDTYLEAAAETLATLHVASMDFPGAAHRWPDDRSPLAIARLYLARIADASHSGGVSRPIATALRRLAREGAHWVTAAGARIEAHPDLLRLHIHGDYQPHNLAFEGDRVCAIYDFDAMRWDWRILELAYALMAFAGLRWEDDTATSVDTPTPPLVGQGLDLQRARAFLTSYGQIAPPQPGEADLIGDALLLVLPVIFANGIAEDLMFSVQNSRAVYGQRECREHLEWALTFPAWIETHRATLRDAWLHSRLH